MQLSLHYLGQNYQELNKSKAADHHDFSIYFAKQFTATKRFFQNHLKSGFPKDIKV
jgi:hypothetical protein